MKYLTIGAVLYLAIAIFGAIVLDGDERERAKGAILGVAAMAGVAFAGRYRERRDRQKTNSGIISAGEIKRASGRVWPFVLLFIGQAARALILFMAIAAGAGLILWGAIKLWSAALSVHPMLDRRQHVRVTVTDTPVRAARPIRLISATPHEIHEADASAPWAYRKAAGTRLEWSDDLVEWKAWEPTGAQVGFWRARE